MALASYSDLKTSIASWLRRTDLTSAIPDFITLAEAQVNRRLRVADMTLRAQAAITTEFSAVPNDFGGVKAFELQTDPITPLVFLSAPQMAEQKQFHPGTGKPIYFTITGGEFQYLPAPDGEYTAELTYYQALPALSDANTSNWLLEKHPDAYLYGALMQSAPYLKNDERLGTWAELFTTILDDITAQDARATYGSPLTMRRRVPS